jgi:putative membrane-bound dehydrogenase-like protein
LKSRLRIALVSNYEDHRPVISRRILLPAALVIGLIGRAADFPSPHNSETTPGSPMAAEEAAAKWKVPSGFKVNVFAAEPDVQNPIACAWDPRGRLWIAENYTYAEHTVKWEAKLRDRVLIFEDADGDGRHDKRTVFTDDVQHLTSVEVGLGGVWLMCPPQVLFIPDRNRDDVPDGPAEVVLDGFAVPPENYHNFANGLRWGPDGWLYGRCGGSAPGLVGAPGTRNEQRVPLSGGIWRYHPTRKVFEALCHGTTNPWGSDWNEDGEMFFTNTVNGHLWHMIPGAHYTRPHTIDPNPYVYELIDQHADHYHFDTGKGWQASRDGANGADALGGGHAHCGAMIYLGDNWPKEYRGKLMTLNFHGRRINVERLERQGSGYIGKHEPDICFSADPFFRGIDLSYGPDGGVFILDWSDTGECHENTGVHRTSGRIYKITYGDPMKPAAQNLEELTNEELVELHEHPNEWFARMARRTLVERANDYPIFYRFPAPDERIPYRRHVPDGERLFLSMYDNQRMRNVASSLRSLLTTSLESSVRVRVLCTLIALDKVDPEFSVEQTRNSDASVRAVAIRALTDRWPLDSAKGDSKLGARAFATEFEALAVRLAREDSSAKVRLALASSLSRCWLPSRETIAKALVARTEDASDHNIPSLIWYAIAPLASEKGARLEGIFAASKLPLTRRLIARRVAAGSEKDPELLARLLATQQRPESDVAADLLTGLLQGFTGWRKAPEPTGWGWIAGKLSASNRADLDSKVRELNVLFGDGRALDDVKALALNDKADLESRKAALRSLIDAHPDDLRAVCEKLLSVRFLNTVAARGLALSEDPAVGVKLAKNYKTFHPSERATVIETLVSRPTFAKSLLEEVAAGRISREDVSAYHARQIRNLGDAELTAKLGQVWGEVREGGEDKRALIAKWKSVLNAETLAKADKSAGRVVFNQVCTACHLLYGQGGQIGPDLTGSGRNNLDYLLENILDPGAVVTADFRLNVVTLKDGRVLNGMVGAKTDRTMTLKTMTEPVTVERSEILKQEELPQSLMPDGLLQAFSQDQVRDLIGYLMNPTQVPLPTDK